MKSWLLTNFGYEEFYFILFYVRVEHSLYLGPEKEWKISSDDNGLNL